MRVLRYMLDENEFLGPMESAPFRVTTWIIRIPFWVGPHEYTSTVPAGGIEYGDIWREFELARPGVDAGECIISSTRC